MAAGAGAYFFFYPGPYPGAQTWQFSSYDGSTNSNDFLNGGFDQRVHFQVIIDGSAGQYYARLTDSTGDVSETAHHPITSSAIASLNTVTSIQDYRYYYGVDLDNVAMTTNVANIPAIPVPAAVWLFGSALAGLGLVGRRSKDQLIN